MLNPNNNGQAPMYQITQELTRSDESIGHDLVTRFIELGLLDGETPAERSRR